MSGRNRLVNRHACLRINRSSRFRARELPKQFLRGSRIDCYAVPLGDVRVVKTASRWRCNRQLLFHQILCFRKLPFVEVHVALSRLDVGVPQQPSGVLDSFLPADFRPAFVAR